MASAAQIEANRRNASGSTGPRTAKGKSRARGNALKHGLAAVTLLPGLTHEDPHQLREKNRRLIDELQPSNQAELDQVCQSARLTRAIERADRFEDDKRQMADERCEVESGGCDEGQNGELRPEGSSGPVVGQDSNLVIDDSTNDKIGILSHEGADAADGVRQGDAPEQSPASVKPPQKAPNEAIGRSQ